MGHSISQIPTRQGSAQVSGECPETQATTSLSGIDPVHAAIAGRVNVSPKRLLAPGPSSRQLDELLTLAAAAPDHGHLLPWRLVLIPQEQRQRLGDAFVHALLARDPSATPEQLQSAAEKAHRAPLLLLAVACLGNQDSGIPAFEQLVSLGAAIQNLLLGATAMGFGSGLTSGQAMNADPLRALFRLGSNESAVCFVNIGTVSEHKRSKRARPERNAFVSTLN